MKLLDPIVAWQDEIRSLRRDLHAHPELAYEEKRTAGVVAKQLEAWGLEVHRGLAKTGVVGTLHGEQRNGKAIGLRADMDALPMQEANAFAHASTHDGVMHACGHDGHTAMLLSAARYLAKHRQFSGTIHFIFQPAEEGQNGAKKMIDDGLFTLFPMQAVFGMHNWPGVPAGTFCVHDGPVMASSSVFTITIQGKGAHAAMPHLGHDPVVTAMHLGQAFQTLISREINPLSPAVLSITKIDGGTAENVIPDQATMVGTVRTFDTDTLDQIETRMQVLTELTCQAHQCTAQFEFDRRYPATINNSAESQFCAKVLSELVGADNVWLDSPPSMGAEDFAFMLQEVPGAYVWIGNGDGSHRSGGHGAGPCMLHNSSYDFNDDILSLGATYWVTLAQQRLAQLAKS